MRLFEFFDRIIKYGFALLFFLVPLVFVADTSELFEFNKMMLTYAFTIIIVGAWLIKMVLAGKIIYKRTFLEIPLLIYLGSHALSTIFSIDPHISIWGYYSRFHEGLLASISYILLYFAAVSNLKKEDVKRIFIFSFAAGIIVSIWGALEHFGHSPSCFLVTGKFGVDCWIQDVKSRVFATLGQPNWMAAYLDVLILISLGILKQVQNDKKNVMLNLFQHLLPGLFFMALLFTKSRSGILGLGVGLEVFFLLSLKKFNKSLLVLLASFVLLALLFGLPFAQTENFSLEKKLSPKVVSHQPVSSAGYIDIGISASEDIRKIVWEGAVKVWQRYPIFGSGVETFAYAYYLDRPIAHNMVSEWDFLYNKAHNEYLNLLATTGSVGMAAYILIIIAFIISQGVPLLRQGDTFKSGLFAAWVSILVTNFFGFSVVIIGLYFFLIPAFCVILGTNEVRNPESDSGRASLARMTIIALIGIIGTIGILNIFARWQADKDYNIGKSLNSSQQVLSAYTYLKQAVKAAPDEPTFKSELAYNQAVLAVSIYDQLKNSTSSALVNMTESEKMAIKIPQIGISVAELSQQAIDNSDNVIATSPKSFPFWKDRLKTFFQLANINPKYDRIVLDAVNNAAKLAPTDAKIHYLQGWILERSGKTNEAINVLEKTVVMKPDYRDAHFLLGQYYEKIRQVDKAREQMQFIVNKIGPDKEALKWLEK